MTIAFTLCCNAALTIRQLIDHHAPVMDYHIICEGPSLAIPKENGNGLRMTGGKPHSSDGTLEILQELKRKHSNLVVIQQKEPWPGKTAKVQAALDWLTAHKIKAATLVQLDYDEFWFRDDLKFLIDIIANTVYTEAEVYARHFWPTTEYHTRLLKGTFGNGPGWRRVFKWHGEPALSHEPPRFLRNAEALLEADTTRAWGIFMHHYSYCTESQFRAKEQFYGMAQGALVNERNRWLGKDLTQDSPHGPLVRYTGPHPIDIQFLHE